MATGLVPDNRIWTGGDSRIAQTRLFRRSFDLAECPARAELRIFAEQVFHVSVNGRYVGRGPSQHHPHRRPVDRFGLSEHLREGRNVLAVLVHAPGIALHCYVPSAEPGLTARLEWVGADGRSHTVDSDRDWRVTDKAGWLTDVPRRSWAIGMIECFDAAAGPSRWQEVGFDDSGWSVPEVHTPASQIVDCRYHERVAPPLRYSWHDDPRLIGLYRIDEPPRAISAADNSAATGSKALMDARWQALSDTESTKGPGSIRVRPAREGGFAVGGLTPDHGAILCFDLGQERVGQVCFDAICPTAGTIDVGWSEAIENGRPLLVRKGVSYVDRVLAAPGEVRWHPIGYSGMRYLVLVLRGFTGDVRFTRFGLLASEPDLPFPDDATLTSRVGRSRAASPPLSPVAPEPALDRAALARLCVHTLRVGTQEGPIDCPTREQSTYIGDGHLICRWIKQLTGDARYWAMLVDDQFTRPSPQGLLRSSVYTGGNDCLVDYSLLAVIGLRDYWRHSGDLDRVRRWIDHGRRIVAFFESMRDPRGLIAFNWERPGARQWEQRYDPSLPDFTSKSQLNLFIDHAGMGWHNQGEAGIDRRGSNTALTALDVLTRRALADLEDALGETGRATAQRAKADGYAAGIAHHCFDPSRGFFVDGILDDRPLAQVSEQTNTWAVAARCCDDATARDLLRRLLTTHDPTIARNGPYFWAYLFPELKRLGLDDVAEQKLALWQPMLDAGATTLWETFKGDDLDSFCHPWSAAPLEWLWR